MNEREKWRKTRLKVLLFFTIGTCVFYILNEKVHLPEPVSFGMFWLLWAATVGYAYVQCKLVRCPHCKSYAKRGWDGTSPVYCPRCGKKLGEGRLE